MGLSGIGYGLFGFLWIASRYDTRFRNVIDYQTITLFTVWFVLCVVLTSMKIWNVGNMAHAAGLVIGVSLAKIVTSAGWHRILYANLTAIFLLLIGLASTIWLPIVNISYNGGQDLAYLRYQSLVAGQNEQAVQMRGVEAGWWYDLGIAYQKMQQYPESLQAYQKAVELGPNKTEYKKALNEIKTQVKQR